MLGRSTFFKYVGWKFLCRSLSFKPLTFEINYNETELQKGAENSKISEKILKNLSEFAEAGGGAKGIYRHTVKNKKLLVRDRLKLLFDPDSPFLEIGLFAGLFMDYGNIPTAGIIVGIGKIHGQFCIVGANDATVKGGAFYPITVAKQIRMQQLGYLNRLPCIYLVDSGGAFLPLQADIFPDSNHGGRTFYNEAVMSSIGIPQIAVVCGSSTAGGAYAPTMAEEAIIVKQSGVIFLGGPPLVKAATGEIVSEQDLGGALMHCSISGCTDYYAETEEEAFEMCRESILTFNSPVHSKPIYQEPLYSAKDLLLLSGKPYLSKEDMYMILSRILDGSMFKEFKAKFGLNLITGFGYLHGILVGILANCNALTFQDAQKGAHFIQLCDKRNIPLCFLQNSGQYEDHNIYDSTSDVLKCRAKMVAAHSSSKVPKITLCINGCFEDDNFVMCGWPFQPNFFLSWPLTEISSTKTQSKIKSVDFLNQLANAKNIDNYDTLFENNVSAYSQASHMLCDGIISPESTRQVLALCVEIASNRN